jgi:arylformamidase
MAGGFATDLDLGSAPAAAALRAVDSFTDQIALDRAVEDPGSPSWAAALQRWRTATAAARRDLGPGTARYGTRADQAVDIYAPPGASGAPVAVFIAGGGWHALSRALAGFPAPAAVAAGLVFVALDVPPGSALADVLNQARRAIKWVHGHIAAHGGDPARISLWGQGTGAHVAAMVAGTNWTQCGLPAATIRSALLIGGFYDLVPLQDGPLGATLRLDRVTAMRLSPLRNLPPPACRVTVAQAAREARSVARQSDRYTLALRTTGAAPRSLVLSGHDHFSAADALADAASPLATAAIALAQA